MRKEVIIIITIVCKQSCGMSYSAIYADTEDKNLPKAVRNAETLTFSPEEIKYNKKNDAFGVAFLGKFNQDENIKVKFAYTISKDEYDMIRKTFLNNSSIQNHKDPKKCISVIKSIIDKYGEPFITMGFDE